MKFSIGVRVVLANVIGCAGGLMAAETGPARPKQDAKGNPIRYAATGHASNYDEAKVGSFVLPDPLVLQNGKPVKDAATWNTVRRPELIALYEREIFGAVPTRAPKVSADVVATEVGAGLFRRYDIMRSWYDDGMPYAQFVQLDGLHLNDFGQKCIGRLLTRSILGALTGP